MKKTYIIPATKVVAYIAERPLAGSGVKSDNGIDYGGVDTGGTQDPDAKANYFGDTLFD